MRRAKLNEEAKIEQPTPEEPFHSKYRPRVLKEVIGQGDTIRSLEAMLKARNRPHTFLFTGPSGVGKTTLARILAWEFNCDPANIKEVDAASNSGIDAMREITSSLRYNGFGERPNKAVIIDECHGLSKQAWDSLLITTEKPPPHVYFFFCSTIPEKIPATIATRCVSYHLKPLRFDDLMDLLELVCDAEDLQSPGRHLEMVSRACSGSPRHALTMLAKIHDCEMDEEVAALLEEPLDNVEIIELCRDLVANTLTWDRLTGKLKALDMPAESIRIIVSCYLASCLMGARGDKQVIRLLNMAECFAKPCTATDKLAPLLIMFGRYIFD